MDLTEIGDDIYSGKYRFNTENQEPLRDMHSISQEWPQPPSYSDKQLHIVVTLPDSPTLVDMIGEYFICLFTPAHDI